MTSGTALPPYALGTRCALGEEIDKDRFGGRDESGTFFPCAPAGRSIAADHLRKQGRRLGGLRPVGWISPVKVFVVDPHSIYRRGLAASLELLDEVESVAHAGSVRDAWEHPALFASDIVLLDQTMDGGPDFIAGVAEATGASVIACSSESTEDAVLATIQAGAIGFLRKDTLTPERLAAAVQAAASGSGVVAPDLLAGLLRSIGTEAKPSPSRLNEREQQVLTLIAAGHPTREVAEQLCYSERTVKNVLHDVVTKLNARSRSQAVAFAVREGLI
jgi:DNA-binding NarL/FixJ family response regulator